MLEELDRREPDSSMYVRPQERFADVVVSFLPGEHRDASHLCARVTLRSGLVHPDLAPYIDEDMPGMTLIEGDDERTLEIAGDIEPAYAAHIEEAIWDRLHFASHLRSERLGEFTIGTHLHRSESLALVQLLIVYHLVTARASVALGGEGSRADRAGAVSRQPDVVAP